MAELIYASDVDEFCCKWLRVAPVKIDVIECRSISDISSDDLMAYSQVHFFAGIGGWIEALRLSGMTESHSVWTGSCPCQPFSNAGKQLAEKDSRHLWPEMFRLIKGCKPYAIFGEQVASKKALGWWDNVSGDLWGAGYSTRAGIIDAACLGFPQRRRRLFWSAMFDGQGGARSFSWGDISEAGSGGWRGQEDLQSIARNPYQQGDHFPQPLIRSLDDGLQRGMARRIIHGYGNAIIPQVGSFFIESVKQSMGVTKWPS